MKRRYVLTFCGTGLSLFAGCHGGISDTSERSETSSGTETTTAALSPTTPASEGQDSERNASPHEFVHVEPVEDESELDEAASNETVSFRNLSAQRQQTFRKALDREEVAAEGWSYRNDSRPVFVRYNGSWFRVIIGVH